MNSQICLWWMPPFSHPETSKLRYWLYILSEQIHWEYFLSCLFHILSNIYFYINFPFLLTVSHINVGFLVCGFIRWNVKYCGQDMPNINGAVATHCHLGETSGGICFYLRSTALFLPECLMICHSNIPQRKYKINMLLQDICNCNIVIVKSVKIKLLSIYSVRCNVMYIFVDAIKFSLHHLNKFRQEHG